MEIEDPELFAKQLQDVLDIIDCLKKDCLPTQKKSFDHLEREALKLMELVEEQGRDPREAVKQHFETKPWLPS